MLVAPPSGNLAGLLVSVTPSAADLRLGQVVFFETTAGGLRVQPQWRFVGPSLLQQTAPGGFVATGIGKTKLCASPAAQSACVAIVVSR
jgi:hypothetical protein